MKWVPQNEISTLNVNWFITLWVKILQLGLNSFLHLGLILPIKLCVINFTFRVLLHLRFQSLSLTVIITFNIPLNVIITVRVDITVRGLTLVVSKTYPWNPSWNVILGQINVCLFNVFVKGCRPMWSEGRLPGKLAFCAVREKHIIVSEMWGRLIKRYFYFIFSTW